MIMVALGVRHSLEAPHHLPVQLDPANLEGYPVFTTEDDWQNQHVTVYLSKRLNKSFAGKLYDS